MFYVLILFQDHRELHATVSRVGKSIDRHFIADYAAVAPKAESFCSDTNRPIMEQAIAQHLYRQVNLLQKYYVPFNHL